MEKHRASPDRVVLCMIEKELMTVGVSFKNTLHAVLRSFIDFHHIICMVRSRVQLQQQAKWRRFLQFILQKSNQHCSSNEIYVVATVCRHGLTPAQLGYYATQVTM